MTPAAVRVALPVLALLLAACAAEKPLPEPVAVAVVPAPAPAPAPAPVFAEPRLRGELVQGAMVVGEATPGTPVTLDGRPLRVADNGIFVFGLDRDAPAQVTLGWVDPAGTAYSRELAVKAREYDIQKVTGISQRIMNPTPADQERIDRENAQVGAARQRDDARLDFLQSFAWPADGPITGVFGSQRYYNGVPKRPHYGVDVGVPTGTPVKAPAAGVVTLAHPDMFYSGGTVVIDHGHGISSTLMHLSAVLVKEGERVEQGQVVAKSGATGRSSGPHLDWRMNWFGERIDAELLVPKRR